MRKQVRINGAPKRALDLVGRLRVVLFLPEDVSLVAGAPAERRRYLDIALCQISSVYCRCAERVQPGRHASATRCCGGCVTTAATTRSSTFWDTQLAEHGSLIFQERSRAIQALDRIAAERHRDLTGGASGCDWPTCPASIPTSARAAHIRSNARPSGQAQAGGAPAPNTGLWSRKRCTGASWPS